MPKKTEITCDRCGKDLLTVASGWNEYRLHLTAEEMHNTSNIRYPERQSPPVGDCYFCDLSCLEGWITQRAADLAKLRAAVTRQAGNAHY